jgi:hypothetical protein
VDGSADRLRDLKTQRGVVQVRKPELVHAVNAAEKRVCRMFMDGWIRSLMARAYSEYKRRSLHPKVDAWLV